MSPLFAFAVSQALFPELIRAGDALAMRELLLKASASVLERDAPEITRVASLAVSSLLDAFDAGVIGAGFGHPAEPSPSDVSRVLYTTLEKARVMFPNTAALCNQLFLRESMCCSH